MQPFKIEPVPSIALETLQHGVVLDIRTQAEYDEKHLAMPHVFIPMDEIDPMRFINDHGDKPIYVLCRSGGRARVVADKLVQAGHADVIVMDGGILACETCGYALAV